MAKASSILINMILILFFLAALAISSYAFIFFLVAMLPTIVAIMIDKRSDKYASHTIGSFNLIGVLPYLYQLWQQHIQAANTAQQMIGDPVVWLRVYSFAAIGWLVIWAVPTIIGHVYVASIEKKMEILKKKQDNLIEEWGIEVKNLKRQ